MIIMETTPYIKKKYLYRSLEELGFESFSQVQEKTFAAFNEPRNILVRSKTGSGKTHAFLIPIFNTLDEESKDVHALIVAPTNELALQLYNVAKQLVQYAPKQIDIRLYDSSLDSNREEERLAKKQPQIVIGTPGKLKELVIKRNALKAYKANIFVADEADMTFDAGFADELDALASVMKDAKMLFFSATIHEKIEFFILKYLSNPIYIDLNDTFDNKIDHVWIPIKHKMRITVLEELLQVINPYLALIFVNKKEMVPFVYANLSRQNYNVCMLHGDMPIRERKRVLREIASLKYQYIVATDIAARGIDIAGVSHVIQYELPYDYEFYVHRSGRTARMGKSGICYALYDKLDDEYLNLLSKRGVNPQYFEVVQGELQPFKGRNVRQSRAIPKKNYVAIAEKHIPKSKKVKPGHKKKRQAEVLALAEKLKRKDTKGKYKKR